MFDLFAPIFEGVALSIHRYLSGKGNGEIEGTKYVKIERRYIKIMRRHAKNDCTGIKSILTLYQTLAEKWCNLSSGGASLAADNVKSEDSPPSLLQDMPTKIADFNNKYNQVVAMLSCLKHSFKSVEKSAQYDYILETEGYSKGILTTNVQALIYYEPCT